MLRLTTIGILEFIIEIGEDLHLLRGKISRCIRIDIERSLHIGMTQYCLDCFQMDPRFTHPCSECMPQPVVREVRKDNRISVDVLLIKYFKVAVPDDTLQSSVK